MKLPGTEKRVPAFSQIVLVCAFIAFSSAAWADPATDYQEGLKSYRAGDVFGAMAPLKQAADAGHAEAQALYGSILDSGEYDIDAAAYLLKAAEQNNADGQYGLAKMYISGEAKAPSEGEANRLMRAAAAQGHSRAIIVIALAYVHGDTRLGATDSNTPEAGQFLIQAAELGEVEAVETLATAYRKGTYGLTADSAKADHWAAQLARMRGQGPKKGAKK
ncbi:tetratricopeptide repeat protein [Aromatoleum diolicum]|uniref:Sel1 repeat family protein n=1 Tax=Aromatoleum diolicum TaxID=75796 RepID=A0ABX1QEA5_9RHOO|nr:sel1 repeat family protein [Aromatoleum diolicum]NMG75722.1 sel1 repeat family protein [Aromatoleum diolicum]